MKTITQIEKAIERLSNGKHIRNDRFKELIGENSYEEFLTEIEEHKKTSQKPIEIKTYIKLLNKACYYDSLMEKHGGKYANMADSAFEDAWECAREMVQTNHSLSLWFDRSVFNDASSDRSSIPRIIGSRSFFCENKDKKPFARTIREIKLGYLGSKLMELKGSDLGECLGESNEMFIRSKSKKNLDSSGFIF
jgi:hypothetical protein